MIADVTATSAATREPLPPLLIYESAKHVGSHEYDSQTLYYAHDCRVSLHPLNS